MQTQSDVSPTGRRIDHRSHLLQTAQDQLQSLRPYDRKSAADRQLLATALQLQNCLLRKDLAKDLTQSLMTDLRTAPTTTLPAMDFSSLEQRIANPCAHAPYYP
jgi:hypothetical protein